MKVLHAFVAIFWGIAAAGCIPVYHPGLASFTAVTVSTALYILMQWLWNSDK